MIIRRIPIVATVVLLSACTGGRSSGPPDSPDPADPDAGNGETPSPLPDGGPIVLDDGGVLLPDGAVVPLDAAPPGDGCATPPLGSFSGYAKEAQQGAGGGQYTRVDIQWDVVSSESCVDRYQPSGTVKYHLAGHWCTQLIEPDTGAVEATDGELVIDRSTNPASYTIRGTSLYDTSVWCEGDPMPPPSPHGGRWVEASGTFDGAVIAGGYHDESSGHSEYMRWRFLRTGVTFTPPGAECSEPARDTFTTTSTSGHTEAAGVVWTRASTEGCVDRFTPSGGLVTTPIEWHETCVNESWEPQTSTVQPDDGELVIDRSVDPATFTISGNTSWTATWTCTENGITHVQERVIGGRWADFEADFDGTRWSGAFWNNRWSFAP